MRSFFLLLSFLFSSLLISQSNQYLHFDRANDYVYLENGSQYLLGSTGMTMAGWFYTDDLVYGQGMIGLRGSNSGFYFLQLSDGVVECRFINSNGVLKEVIVPAGVVMADTWQHFAFVYSGTQILMYVDGVLIGSVSASGTLTDSSIAFTIGRSILSNLNFYFGGRADEVSLWSKGLTQAEITDMMDNELVGDEANLELYYKMNQGFPGEDNSSISMLQSLTGFGERDADLLNFEMIGANSNFNGSLEPGYQTISLPALPAKLFSDAPFALNAISTSALPVNYEILSGPATVAGNIVTLTGATGTVVVRATQAGDAQYEAAAPIINSFEVLDPELYVPQITNIVGLDQKNYYMTELKPALIAVRATIGHPELFYVDKLRFINGTDTLQAHNGGDGYFYTYWQPLGYGPQFVFIEADNNLGGTAVSLLSLNINNTDIADQSIEALDEYWITSASPVTSFTAELPCYLGAYDQILANLTLSCPPMGGCGAWDYVAKISAQDYKGQWQEIIRYVTPYGTPCSHQIDLTDFKSILQGIVNFKIEYGAYDNGYEFSLSFDYRAGDPTYDYTHINKLWEQSYPFGDPANLQPVPSLHIDVPSQTEAAKIKLVSTGHGWGDNNTDNAAEFSYNTHHIWLDNVETFTQYNFANCDPNPDNCDPQSGTWYFDRAGWCPGSIAPFFDFELANGNSLPDSLRLDYVFDESYYDFCHPNNPDCVTGVTCPNCEDGYNPELIVASSIIFYSNEPIIEPLPQVINSIAQVSNDLLIYPNPTSDYMIVELPTDIAIKELHIVDVAGRILLKQSNLAIGSKPIISTADLAQGIYTILLLSDQKSIKKEFVKL